MMTPQEVANCTFAKAVMGGYNMASVDDFLDKLTEDYTALYKENAALKAKLKVLADKMEEYRQVEDAMRSTLLTAQKMATTMVSEAEQKRDAIIADAAAGAKARLQEIQREVEAEEARLADVRRDVDRQVQAEEQRVCDDVFHGILLPCLLRVSGMSDPPFDGEELNETEDLQTTEQHQGGQVDFGHFRQRTEIVHRADLSESGAYIAQTGNRGRETGDEVNAACCVDQCS